MPAPLISIITVCYNAASLICKSLDSAMKQDFQDFELVIVDGGSSDNTLELLQAYSSKIGALISEKDKGIYDAMNKGVQLAKGEWIYFLNAGDSFFDKQVLSSLFLNQQLGGKSFLYGKVQTVNEPTGIDYVAGEEVSISDFYSRYPICHQATFSRKSLFTRLGGFDTRYKLAADTEWFARLFSRFPEEALFVNRTIAYYDIQGTTYRKRMQGYREYLHFGKRHFPLAVSIKNHLFYPLLWLKVKLIRGLTDTQLFKAYRKFKFKKQLAN